MHEPRIGLLGAGAQAREVEAYLPPGAVVFRAVTGPWVDADDAGAAPTLDLTRPSTTQRATPVVAAVGLPGVRRNLVAAWPGSTFATVVAPGAFVARDAALGDGAVVAPGAIISAGVVVGRHGLLNVGASVSHDVVLGDCVTVSPGARVGGGARLGDGVFVGIGAVIRDGVTIAEGVLVGAGAVVLHDLTTPLAVVAGNPARQLSVGTAWPVSLGSQAR